MKTKKLRETVGRIQYLHNKPFYFPELNIYCTLSMCLSGCQKDKAALEDVSSEST